jgi:hypothetical protein
MHLTLLQFMLRVLACLALILALGDVITTNRALSLAGVHEANPVMAFLQRVLGGKWIIARMLLPVLCLYMAFKKDGSWSAIATLTFNDALIAYVVWNNWRIWQRRRPA